MSKRHKKQKRLKWRPVERAMMVLAILGLIVAIVTAIAAWR
jgi:hypothetical protein